MSINCQGSTSLIAALASWGIDRDSLDAILVLSSGEMVKAVIESGVGAAAISELMVKKELQLGTLKSIQVMDDRTDEVGMLEIARPFLKLKHLKRFQTNLSRVFEQMLTAKITV